MGEPGTATHWPSWPVRLEAAPPSYLVLEQPDMRRDEAWARFHLRAFHGWDSKRVFTSEADVMLDAHAAEHTAIEWEQQPDELPRAHTHSLIVEASLAGDRTLPQSIRLALLSLVVGVRWACDEGWRP